MKKDFSHLYSTPGKKQQMMVVDGNKLTGFPGGNLNAINSIVKGRSGHHELPPGGTASNHSLFPLLMLFVYISDFTCLQQIT